MPQFIGLWIAGPGQHNRGFPLGYKPPQQTTAVHRTHAAVAPRGESHRLGGTNLGPGTVGPWLADRPQRPTPGSHCRNHRREKTRTKTLPRLRLPRQGDHFIQQLLDLLTWIDHSPGRGVGQVITGLRHGTGRNRKDG